MRLRLLIHVLCVPDRIHLDGKVAPVEGDDGALQPALQSHSAAPLQLAVLAAAERVLQHNTTAEEAVGLRVDGAASIRVVCTQTRWGDRTLFARADGATLIGHVGDEALIIWCSAELIGTHALATLHRKPRRICASNGAIVGRHGAARGRSLPFVHTHVVLRIVCKAADKYQLADVLWC